MKLRLAENFRAVFYAPFYALKALGHAERAGLEIEWLAPGDPGGAIDAVKSGAIDLTWGGPMRVIKDHDSAPDNGASLLSFGEAVGRDPFSLVGRAGLAARDLHDLPSLRLGVVSEVPTPWYCLRADLHDRGIDIARDGRLVEGLTMPRQVQALADGTLDVAQLFEPCASQALAAGGRLLYDAASRGPTVYTTFICTRDGLARNAGVDPRARRARPCPRHGAVLRRPGAGPAPRGHRALPAQRHLVRDHPCEQGGLRPPCPQLARRRIRFVAHGL
ncbi:ABC transporter substrate-binding protein [Bordetella bronchiseptica]|uniref:ABC transporter substrate-binding protein n=1 Tax=Bordetella bronchiseptica TaxID=518 RepID=UPI001E497557|nr:ABC transporter substrate-binding protein [Bordetella bronchiseptica]